jgi:hypothetical protein
MKTLDLNAYGVSEMCADEMLAAEGGNIFQAIGNAIAAVARAVADWIDDHCYAKVEDGKLKCGCNF